MKLQRVAQEAVKVVEAGIRATIRTPREEPLAVSDAGTCAESDREPREDRALFISVKPQYANAILDGTKTVELRRTRPNLPDGSLVILYSSTPTKAVVGWALLTRVREGTPGDIWNEFGADAAIKEPDYDTYFDGAEHAIALELDDVVAASNPVPLSVIRSIGIQPPQSWRYVPAAITSQIQDSAAL